MLKIKDNVDLKELEKFGFKIDEYWCEYGIASISIKKRTRTITIGPTFQDKDLMILYDLIKADLVEKVVSSMSAKEMFEKLGYKEIHRFSYVKWYNEEKNNTIWFWQEDEHISVINTDITMEVLQAINKQVEELGWNNVQQ